MAKPEFGCHKCGKPVYPVDGKLTCCGITETLDYARRAAKQNEAAMRRALAPMFAGITGNGMQEDDEW